MNKRKLLESVFHECAELEPKHWDEKLSVLTEEEQSYVRKLLESARSPSDVENSEFLPSLSVSENAFTNETLTSAQLNRPTRTPGPGSSSGKVNPTHAIGGYPILNEIAVHGQGAVYRANHPHLNQQVVIKVAKNQVDSVGQQLLIEEAQTLAKLSHPNLAQVFDLQFEDGRPFLVMEYIEGRNLAELLKEQTFSPSQSADLIRVLATAIHHVHSVGIVHQDLKPANVVIKANDGTPKVIDFGIAQSRSAYTDQNTLSTYGGTIAYMAPEQAARMMAAQRGEMPGETDKRVDIFALGAILYKMLKGRSLYEFKDSAEGVLLAADCEFDAELSSEIPKYLREACLKALAKNPEERWQTAEEFAEALGTPKPWFKDQWKLGVATLAVVSLVLFAIWNGTNDRGNDANAGSSQDVAETARSEGVMPASEVNSETPARKAELDLRSRTHFAHISNATNGSTGVLFENGPVRKDDELKIETAFAKPSYCFLIALNPPDGSIQLCYPEGDDGAWDLVQDKPLKQLKYPEDDAYVFPFSDGVGQQAFILVRSSSPLPSFREWIGKVGDLNNSLAGAKRAWMWNERQLSPVISARLIGVRGAPKKLEGSEAFEALMKRFESTHPELEFFAVCFPVIE